MGLAIVAPPAVDAYTLSEYLEGAAAGAGTGLVIGTVVGTPIGGVVGAMTGALLVPITMFLTEQNSQAYISDTNANIYALNLRNNTVRAVESFWQMAENQVNLYDSSGFMYARYAASAANALYDYQEANELPHEYNAEYVLSQSPIMTDLMTITNYSTECYNNLFNNYGALSQTFTGDYSAMKWGMHFDTSETMVGYDQGLTVLFTNQIIASGTTADGVGGTGWVYLPANATLYAAAGSGYTSGGISNKVISSDGTAILDDTTAYDASNYDGRVLVYHLNNTVGRYHVGSYPSQLTTFFGMAAPDISSSGSVTPAIIPLINGADGTLSTTPMGIVRTGENTYQRWQGSAPIVDDWYGEGGIYFNPGAERTSAMNYYVVPLQKHLNALMDVQNNYSGMIAIANNAGQTQFNAQVASNGTAPRIAPDIMFLDPNQLDDLNAQQMYAVYVAYLNGMKGYFENYSLMDPGQVNISADSFDLVVQGSIYSDTGALLFGPDTVFTPYISLADQSLVIGNNTMTQPGYVIVWSTGEGMSAADITNSTAPQYVQFKAGAALNISAMYYKGEPVTEHTLEVTKLVWVYGDQGQTETPPPQSMTDTDWLIQHWYLMAMVLGVVVLMGAILTRSTAIVIIGLVCLVAGLAGWYLAGDNLFGISLSMAIQNAGQWIIWR